MSYYSPKSSPTAPLYPPGSFAPKRRNPLLFAALVLVPVLAIGAFLWLFTSFVLNQPTTLSDAVQTCGAEGDPYVTLEDRGRQLTIDHEGESSPGTSFETLDCLLYTIGTPTEVYELMDSEPTEPNPSATWGDMTIWWHYTPGTGMDVILEEK